MARTKKKVFTVVGKILRIDREKNGRMVTQKVFLPNSAAHLTSMLQTVSEGPYSVTFEQYVSSRSLEQLHYHWVLVGYIAQHTGYSKEEAHDAIMRSKFGTKEIRIGGIRQEVRRSVADVAHMPTADMSELIEYDLELCRNLDINVPTAEDLGYISNHGPLTPVRREKASV